MPIVTRELQLTYDTLATDSSFALPSPSVSFANFTSWQRPRATWSPPTACAATPQADWPPLPPTQLADWIERQRRNAYTRQDYLLIGSSHARRATPALEAMIGPFNDFLVMRLVRDGIFDANPTICTSKDPAWRRFCREEFGFSTCLDDFLAPQGANQ